MEIYIGGTGRCGTNVLKDVLIQLPQAYGLPFEPRYLLDPDGVFDFYKSVWSPYIVDFKIRRLEKLLKRLSKRTLMDKVFWTPDKRWLTPPSYRKWELDKHIPGFSSMANDLIREITDFKFKSYWCGSPGLKIKNLAHSSSPPYEKSLRKFIDRTTASILEYNGSSIYIDDSTFNILHGEEINALCSESKLIHIYRDPNDVVDSFTNQKWSPDNLENAIWWYKNIFWQWMEQDLPDNFVLQVRFEELVNNPQKILNQISRFTGVDFTGIDVSRVIDKDKANIGRGADTGLLAKERKILGYE